MVWVQAVNALGMEDSPRLQIHLDDIGKEWEILHSFYYRQLIGIDGIKWSKSEQSTPKVPADHKQSNFSGILSPGAILQLDILPVSFLNGSDANMFLRTCVSKARETKRDLKFTLQEATRQGQMGRNKDCAQIWWTLCCKRQGILMDCALCAVCQGGSFSGTYRLQKIVLTCLTSPTKLVFACFTWDILDPAF